jgi:uncharacterized membrane protein YfcA
MVWQDLVNGTFEFGAAIAILLHCKNLLRDKRVMGVSVLATAFFTSWGVWNLYYYKHLGQIWSCMAGVLVVSTNVLWLGMMLYYLRKNKGE